MADKKKMSVADMIAAARKADGGGKASESGDVKPAAEEAASQPESVQPESSEKQPAEKQEAAAETPKKVAGMNVADILAAARTQGKPVAEEKPAVPAQSKPAAEAKPAAKADPAQKKSAAASAPMDTGSILAAARKASKPGPMSKAEAAAKLKPQEAKAPAKGAKPKLIAPPMPAKPDYAKAKTAKAKSTDEDRRTVVGLVLGTFLGMGFTALSATFGLWSLLTARFMFPNVLMEPPNQFKVGFPANFPPDSVDTRFKAQFGVWIVNTEYEGQSQIFALKSVCTHLGCTPNWLEAEQKFKCPCHGSGFYKDGINFEGPAPRPLERYAIRISDDGQIEVDKSATFQEEMGQWTDAACQIPV